MKKLKHFFWLCSGSQVDLLEKCPSDGSKYVGIGATIFFTGVFAAIASSFAIYTFTQNYYWSIGFGLFWGAMIFNLDRFIVSSMRKSDNRATELKMAAPRLILAILISIVIAKPLELKIFEKEINTELVLMNEQIRNEQIGGIRARFAQDRAFHELNIARWKQEIQQKEQKRDELRDLARQEADGTGGTRQRNAGPIYRIKKQNADQMQVELEQLKSDYSELISEAEASIAEINSSEQEAIQVLADPDYSGFAARLEALNRLTKSSSAIFLANWFIILLFIALETAPVLVKILSQRGPYDYLLASEEQGYENDWIFQTSKSSNALRKKAKSFSTEEKEFLEEKLSTKLS